MADDEIKVQITSDASGMQAGVSDAKSSVDDLSSSVKSASDGAIAGLQSSVSDMASSVQSSFASIRDSVLEVVGVLGSLGAVKWAEDFVEAGAGAAEQLHRFSIESGTSVEDLSRLQYAAAATGTPFSALEMAVRRSEMALEQLRAGTGSKQLVGAMRELGVSAADLSNFPVLIDKISESLNQVGAVAVRADLSAIFGRAGLQLMPLIEGARDLTEQSDKLGFTLSGSTVEGAAAAAKAGDTLSLAWRNLKVALTSDLAPALTSTLNFLTRIAQAAQRAGDIVSETFGRSSAAGTAEVRDPRFSMLDKPGAEMPLSAAPPATTSLNTDTAAKTAADGKRALAEQLTAVKAEAAEEIAVAGSTAQAKELYLQQVADFAKAHFPDNSKQVLSALAEEQRAVNEANAEELKSTVASLNDQEKARASAVTVAKATLEQQVVLHKLTTQQEKAAEDQLEIGVLQSRMATLEGEKALLAEAVSEHMISASQELTVEQGLAAQIEELANQIAAKKIQAATAGIAANQAAAKESLSSWQTAMSGIADALDQMVRGVLQGTQSVSQMFEKMAGDILLSIAKSGLKDLLVGGTAAAAGQQASLAYSIFGSGFAGILQSAWQQAVASSAGSFASVISGAFSAAAGALRSVFTSIFSAGAGGLAQAGIGAGANAAAGGGTQLATAMLTSLTTAAPITAAATAVSMAAPLAVQTGSLVTAQEAATTQIVAALAINTANPSFLGIKAERGGVVPSAAGGMVVGGGMGGMLGILHPRETVLPANISEAMQRAIGGGTFGGGGGGGDTHVHFGINAIDGASMAAYLAEHGDMIADMVAKAVSSGRAVQQGYGFR